MTTEEDFQAALDANPHDWQTRLVFADWLDERNDPRAEGYRALGVLRVIPGSPDDPCYLLYHPRSTSTARLPVDWFRLLPGRINKRQARYTWWPSGNGHQRRVIEDAAALAFANLPAARRAELLSGVIV